MSFSIEYIVGKLSSTCAFVNTTRDIELLIIIFVCRIKNVQSINTIREEKLNYDEVSYDRIKRESKDNYSNN